MKLIIVIWEVKDAWSSYSFPKTHITGTKEKGKKLNYEEMTILFFSYKIEIRMYKIIQLLRNIVELNVNTLSHFNQLYKGIKEM